MNSFLKRLTKQHRIAIACSAAGIVLVIIASVAVLLSGAGKHILVSAEPQSSVTEDTASASETISEETSETETATESTAPSETKPPAAPVVKPYKHKPTSSAPKVKKPTKSVKLNVPVVYQNPDYPTGCEGASATMLLKYYGYSISLSEVINAIPREDLYEENGKVYGPSIYEKFVGDPSKTHTDDRPGYGAFSPVITRSLNTVIAKKHGRHTAKNITGCSFQSLLKHLDDGDPIIVWATDNMKTPTSVNSWYIKQKDGSDKYFEYPRGTHVMVLSGYDGSYVYITDPYYGKVKYTYSAFNDKWVLLGRQAIILTDAVIQTTESTAPVTDATKPSKEPVTEPPKEPVTEPSSAEETTRPEETSAETSATISVPEESTGQAPATD